VTLLTVAGLRLLDTAAEIGNLEGLTILGSGSGAGTGLGLLNITPEDTILVSLAILGLGSDSRLLGRRTLCNNGMEPAEAAWCHLRRKEFERSLLNKFRQASHMPPLHQTLHLSHNTQTHRLTET